MPKSKPQKQQDDYKLPRPNTTLTLRDVCPDKICVPLNYFHDLALGGAVSVENLYNLNSLFDPDRTGVGHQPSGFDQWSAFYNRYRVDRVRVQLDFVNNSSTSVTSLLALPNNDATAINTVATLQAGCEAPFAWSRAIATNAGMNVCRYVRSFNLNQIVGVTAAKYEADDSYQAVTSASPTEMIALHVVAQDFGFSTNVNILARVKITYFTTFYDRNQLPIS